MKRMTPLLLAAVLLFSGCAAPATADITTPFEQPFRMTADYAIGEVTGTLLFEMAGIECCTMEYLSPVSVAGMKLALENGVVTSEFLGVTAETRLNDLPQGSPFGLLCSLLPGAGRKPVSQKADESGNVTYEYENGSTVVAGSGIPRRIEAPGGACSLHITGFERLRTE